jgi:ribA/ribD-fused uncharacterized protein
MINEFKSEYRFLSNFWLIQVTNMLEKDGLIYPSVEHAYQAAKSLEIVDRRKIQRALTPSIAKSLGRQLELRLDWDNVKRLIMLNLLRAKFSHLELRHKLIDTGNATLIEGNSWHDNYWGVCYCMSCNQERNREEPALGSNWLGKLLMHVRLEAQIGA